MTASLWTLRIPLYAALPLLLTTAGLPAVGQEGVTTKRNLPAVRFSMHPKIDGDLSDPCWKDAAKADRFTDPVTLKPAPDQTLVYIGYDDANIYIAFHAFDSHPEEIVARQTQRGSRLNSDDNVGVAFDFFRTHQEADFAVFNVNPIGTPSARFEQGRATPPGEKRAWRAAARIAADGWTAEMAIPWASLDYPSTNDLSACEIDFARTQKRTSVDSYWCPVGVHGDHLDDFGHWVGVQFPPSERKTSLPLAAGSSGSQGLYSQIFHMDALLFDAFNAHDLDRLKTFFTKDTEFYHDTGGLTAYRQTMDNFRMLFARNDKLRRELVNGSLEVYPIKNYGALEIGAHSFHHIENGRDDTGTFKFFQVWQKKEGVWKLSRVISYDHKAQLSQNGPSARQELYDKIRSLDGELFNAFNTRNADRMKSYFTDDVEFYHDQGGLTKSLTRVVESFSTKFDSDYRTRGEIVRRALVKDSLEVYPIEGYGAVEIGAHRFFVTRKGDKKIIGVTIGKFVQVWRKIGNQWKIARVLSYDHRPDSASDRLAN